MSRQNDLRVRMSCVWGFHPVGGDLGLIPPATIRAAWMHERAEVHALAGEGEQRMFAGTKWQLQQSMLSRDFRAFLQDADAMGDGSQAISAFQS